MKTLFKRLMCAVFGHSMVWKQTRIEAGGNRYRIGQCSRCSIWWGESMESNGASPLSKPFARLICFIKGHKMTRGQWRAMVPGTIVCNWWCERCRGAERMESKRVPIIIADIIAEVWWMPHFLTDDGSTYPDPQSGDQLPSWRRIV